MPDSSDDADALAMEKLIGKSSLSMMRPALEHTSLMFPSVCALFLAGAVGAFWARTARAHVSAAETQGLMVESGDQP